MVVSVVEKFVESLSTMMPASRYYPVDKAGSINEARRRLSDRQYDIILINTPLPDDFGVRFAIDVSATSGTAVLLFVRGDLYDAIYEKAHVGGVFVLQKPCSGTTLSHALDWLCSIRERMRRMEKKSVTLQEKMEEIKLVNRAKWVLITHLNMTEDAAHRYIEKQAMDRCVSKRIIAEDILRTYKE